MYFRLLTLFLFFVSVSLYAQKLELINSGEVIEKGKILYDSGRFDDAVLTYKTIDRRDTNYVYMLSELALAYLGAEDYPSAINTAEEGITFPSIYRAHLYRSLAIALDRGGEYDKSVETFNKAIAEYPFDYSLHYNLGITYFNHKEYDKAGAKLFETLALNPFHGGSHFNLGKLSVLQGRKTQALMALGLYMGVSPSDNSALVYLEHVLKNEVPEEGSVDTSEPNHLARLDQMIRAKLAMDKGFKSSIPADVAVVKQFELFFDQMPKGIDNPDDPWLSFYLSTYQALKTAGHNETFIYHIVTSAPLDKAEKWRKKNEKQLKDFYAVANKSLAAHRTPKLHPSIEKDKPVSFWYSESNKLEAIGNQISDSQRTGKWVYFYDNGEKSAEGAYNANGEKTGVWTYYYATGQVKSIEDQESGEIKTYNADGEPVERYFMKNDVVNSDVEIFYQCGMIKEKLAYKNNERDGRGAAYFIDGTVESEYAFQANKLTGEYTSYYSTGKVKDKSNYVEGEYDGAYTGYYPNGVLRASGTYANGKATGTWSYYHSNGRLHKKGEYKDDQPAGEWVAYDRRGRLEEKFRYNDTGKLNGEYNLYHWGKLHNTNTYKDDKLVKMVYYDEKGKELSSAGDENGNFTFTAYDIYGNKRTEGTFRDGRKNGDWTYYYPYGGLFSKVTWAEGLAQGKAVDYFATGSTKLEYAYKDDQLDGYYVEYYENGKPKIEGWMKNGDRQQRWVSYYIDGTPESDYFYLNGEVTGNGIHYAEDGRKTQHYTYKPYGIVAETDFEPNGKTREFRKSTKGPVTHYIAEFKSGKVNSEFALSCGRYVADVIRNYPDGSLYYRNPAGGAGLANGQYIFNMITGATGSTGKLVNDEREGIWTGQHFNGKPQYVGTYASGERDSTWVYYHDNGMKSFETDYLNDKRNGVQRVYNPEGILMVEKIYEDDRLIAYSTSPGVWTPFKGDAVIIAKFANGKVGYEETYKHGVYEGPYKLYYSNGSLYSEYTFVKGDYEGDYKVYHPNGKLKERGKYLNDEVDGLVEHFDEQGNLIYSEAFLMGARQGKTVSYKNGRKVKEVNFWGGFVIEDE